MKQVEMFGLTESEMNLICDSMNNSIHRLSDFYWRENLLSSLCEANHYDNLAEKWEVDFKNLIEKLIELTEIEFLLLLLEVMCFWDMSARTYHYLGLIPPHRKIIEILSESSKGE